MAKLTPYGKALLIVGLLLAVCTLAVLFLFCKKDSEDYSAGYEIMIGELEEKIALQDEQAKYMEKQTYRYLDTLSAMRSRINEQQEKLNALKAKADASINFDYRRFTDTELERLLTERYNPDTTNQ